MSFLSPAPEIPFVWTEWHSAHPAAGLIYHVARECSASAEIEPHNLRFGRGFGRRLCEQCREIALDDTANFFSVR